MNGFQMTSSNQHTIMDRAMKKNMIVIILSCLPGGACISVVQEQPSNPVRKPVPVETDATCHNAQTLADSLHIQELDVKGESGAELLDSLGIRMLQDRGFDPIRARRIGGECIDHLDEFMTVLLHFDTGIILRIEQGNLAPYPIKREIRNFIDIDDAHPELPARRFIQAIDTGGGNLRKDAMSRFVGVWLENGRYIMTPYKKQASGAFRVYNDLLESGKPVLGIRFMHHLDTPSGVIFLVLKDGDERILINFIWTYLNLFVDETD